MDREGLEREEGELVWDGPFGAREALALGNAVAALAYEYERGVTCVITRESDGLMLFCWAMDDKSPRNMEYIAWKRGQVRETGHASLWTDPNNEAFGGGVPIIGPAGDLKATLVISGLHHGQDHELAVRALKASIQ